MTEKKISISDFKFEQSGYGHYKVTFTSKISGDSWTAITSDMHLIDATRNAHKPLTKDLNKLKYFCKLKQY